MADGDGSMSFYFFDIDDNLLFLQTRLYLWNAESRTEQAVSSGEFAAIQNQLGRSGKWQPWAVREETFRDFRDRADSPVAEHPFLKDLLEAISSGSTSWRAPRGRCSSMPRCANDRSQW